MFALTIVNDASGTFTEPPKEATWEVRREVFHTPQGVSHVDLFWILEGDEKEAVLEAVHARLPLEHSVIFGRYFEQLPSKGELKFRTPTRWRTYVLPRRSELSNADIVEATLQTFDGKEEVRLTLSTAAKEHFKDLTTQNVGRRLAILIDDEVMNAPMIVSPISGGNISLLLEQSEKALLFGGVLPIDLEVVQQQ